MPPEVDVAVLLVPNDADEDGESELELPEKAQLGKPANPSDAGWILIEQGALTTPADE